MRLEFWQNYGLCIKNRGRGDSRCEIRYRFGVIHVFCGQGHTGVPECAQKIQVRGDYRCEFRYRFGVIVFFVGSVPPPSPIPSDHPFHGLRDCVYLKADSTCDGGIPGVQSANGNVCCQIACGICDGSSCVGYGDCCEEKIQDSGVLCSVSGTAPCIMESGVFRVSFPKTWEIKSACFARMSA